MAPGALLVLVMLPQHVLHMGEGVLIRKRLVCPFDRDVAVL